MPARERRPSQHEYPHRASIRNRTVASLKRGEAARLAASQLSGRRDSNSGPHRPERCALPGCATPRRARIIAQEVRRSAVSGGAARIAVAAGAVGVERHHVAAATACWASTSMSYSSRSSSKMARRRSSIASIRGAQAAQVDVRRTTSARSAIVGYVVSSQPLAERSPTLHGGDSRTSSRARRQGLAGTDHPFG